MVWGVMGLKKSSALSELVTIPRDRLSLAPSPTDRLSIEEIASLPSAGACAMQVMEPICRDLPRGSKILILSAHRSIGYLCLQLASHLRPQRDLYLVAHCPSTMEADAQLCRDAGASSVLVEEPLAVLNGCHESEFDVVIDCVGGRRIYDASRRVLHHSGAFISTVSPLVVPSSSTTAPESSWKSSLRSLRRTFVKKDRKLLSVLSITSETIETRGESPREVLERVREAVEKGELRARIDKVWRFEDSARAFAEGEGESVVRVLEV
ncbi:hypothetical protein BCR35DRAFT_309073 [Leucosporidium creatinivorum]|uniref:Enoyl reductase (ER) domain-containing protein n=1 Tax=Leucosporidium creatinivorum TaxID=106004 RepID=A0A1Y2DPG3_9BASI|nr:hypothetical protein BCR35DRAFT_309073 [Leucosporidium creatinivorum]